jgi:predicted helicase
MPGTERARKALREVQTLPQLVKYLRDELNWPIEAASFEDLDDVVFDWGPDELGIDPENAAKIEYIKQLRPLEKGQPQGVFFVKFDTRRLPVVALRRILSKLVVTKRATAKAAERPLWNMQDLVFVSTYGEGNARQLSFAYFQDAAHRSDLPTLKVLGWDNQDTPLHLDKVHDDLHKHLAWPGSTGQLDSWRQGWARAFELRRGEVIETSKELSIRLAELARAIRDRIKAALAIETDKGELTKLMKAFQTALVHDLDAEGFADMYAQTIAYGLLSARIADPHKKTADDFAAHMRTNPFLRELMETFLKVGGRRGRAGGQAKSKGIDFDELGVSEVVELLDASNMEAVVRDFGDRNPHEDPVIHFYELFLKEYDAAKRMQRGVFYTPRPVVSYIVRSVDQLLRTGFGLADGLADTTTWGEMAKRNRDLKVPEGISPDQDFVQILDPATGTGTFLVEVIDLIHKTLVAKWKTQGHGEKRIGALWNEYVPKHLLSRLHGYELLMAPYAIAHLKIGLKLYETGYLFGSDERARVYLTNALEPAHDSSGTFEFAIPALAHEAQAVNKIKRTQRFTAVVGNPPYAGVSSNMNDHAQRLVDAYKRVDGAALNERKLWLQDDYVKFIRQAQLAIEQAGTGILGYITNHGYLDNPTFRGMRQSLMHTFASLHVLDLHGNALKKERAPDGSDDKNIFEIRQGVAILVGSHYSTNRIVCRADLWGTGESKTDWLGSHSVEDTPWKVLEPATPFYFLKVSEETSAEAWSAWRPLSEVMPTYSSGVITARDELVLDYEPGPILDRIMRLRDRKTSDESLRQELFTGKSSPKYAPGDSRGWKLPAARKKLREDEQWRDRVAPCSYRPFDRRCVYMTEWMVDWSRPEIRRHLRVPSNPVLVFPRNTGAGKPWDHVFVSYEPILGRFFPDSACITYMAPMLVLSEGILGREATVAGNFRDSQAWGLTNKHEIRSRARQELGYIYSILHSPMYRARYLSHLRADFPRIPLTPFPTLFESLAQLGGELTAMHLLESPKVQKLVTELFGGRNPEVEKVSWSENTVWLDKAQTTGFKGVREDVWNFHIGGYQVCEKWLKDRKGRTLSKDDIAHYQKIVVALSETIRLMKEIDEVIEKHGGWPAAFAPRDATPDLAQAAEPPPPRYRR